MWKSKKQNINIIILTYMEKTSVDMDKKNYIKHEKKLLFLHKK